MIVKLAQYVSTSQFNYRDKTGFHNWLVNDIHKAKHLPGGTQSEECFTIRKNLDPKRVDAADLSFPVLISTQGGHLVDGQHRIAKARKLGIKDIDYKFVDLSKVRESELVD